MVRRALITGGNSGIGYATAELLVARDYEVTISGRNPQRVAEAAERLGAKALVADVASVEQLNGLAEPFLKEGLDVLVNSAGMGQVIPIGQYTEEGFAEHINVNLRGPLFLIQALLPALQARRGVVVSVSTVAAETGGPSFVQYAAAKAGLNAMSRCLSMELAPLGVRTNVVSPGPVETPIFAKLGVPEEQVDGVRAGMLERSPLGRLGQPEDVARAILAQIENPNVTGAVWQIDGGFRWA
ncbi:MAG: SDR family oxidoreductase [Gammaproteobacteria bacterium]|nr:SDR family oxidoreductase [Gammaproteobacteria bacterium]